MDRNTAGSLEHIDFVEGMETWAASAESLETGSPQSYGLSDWYYGNQQIMNLLDDDLIFS